MQQPGQRSGFTLIELITTLAILALLLTITLAAVQQVRSRARRLDCLNRVKEIALLVHTDQEARRFYISSPFSLFEHGPIQRDLGIIAGLYTNSRLICPADTGAHPEYEHSNYLFGAGTTFSECVNYNGFARTIASYSKRKPIRPADITDGLSSTVMISERLAWGRDSYYVPEEEALRDAKRFPWQTQTAYHQCGEEFLAAQECQTSRTTNFPVMAESSPPVSGSKFSHLLPPNSFSCSNPINIPSAHIVSTSVLSATSLHNGGVNGALCDGSARFFANSIDTTLWRSLGTINGGENVVVP